jgi:hypothetical protein
MLNRLRIPASDVPTIGEIRLRMQQAGCHFQGDESVIENPCRYDEAPSGKS